MQEEGRAPLSAPLTDTDPSTPGPPRRLRTLFLLAAVATLLMDQGSKVWALRALADGHRIPVAGDLVTLVLVRNPGAAFSIGADVTWVLTALATAVTVAIALAARRTGHLGWALCLGLLFGGSIGNLIDRFFREPGPGRGHVVDFIDYAGLFVGNIADLAIVGAAVAIALLALRGVSLRGIPTAERTEREGESGD